MADERTEQWNHQKLSHWLPGAWAAGFLRSWQALNLSGAAEPQLEINGPNLDLWAKWTEPLWIQLPCNLAEGSLLAGCTRETVLALTRSITGHDEVGDDTSDDTYLELLNQTAAFVAAEASVRLRTAVQFGPASRVASPARADLGIEFRFRLAEANHLLALVPNPPLVALLSSPAQGGALPQLAAGDIPDPPADRSGGNSGAKGKAGSLSEEARYNLELLLEVELDLSVSFGRTVLPLEDVLKLSSGSIVELNRSAADPVDVLVNDSVIARGEVVVVDGNYGIRVTEIVSRKERIRSIF